MIIQVEIGKDTNALINAISSFVKVAKDQLKDGFQPGDDLAPITLSALQVLAPAFTAADSVGEEFEKNPDSKSIAMALLANELMSIFSK